MRERFDLVLGAAPILARLGRKQRQHLSRAFAFDSYTNQVIRQ
jgi:hypothetical protein